MKNFKKITNIITITILFIIIFFSAGLILFPESFQKIVPFKLHVIITDSMDPRIPTNSLVVAGNANEINEGDIIIFKAIEPSIDPNNKIIIAHYFKNTYVDDNGRTYYQTYNEKSGLDNYLVSEEDIIASYKFHIPYIGKFFLFLKSKFGFLLIAQLFIIYCLYLYFNKRCNK